MLLAMNDDDDDDDDVDDVDDAVDANVATSHSIAARTQEFVILAPLIMKSIKISFCHDFESGNKIC